MGCSSAVVNLIDQLLPLRLNPGTLNTEIKCLSPNPDLHWPTSWSLINTGCLKKRVISEIWLGCPSRPFAPFITCWHAQKEYQGTPGYYRKHFFVPTVHSIAPISPTIEANIIESYIANHPFFRHPVCPTSSGGAGASTPPPWCRLLRLDTRLQSWAYNHHKLRH